MPRHIIIGDVHGCLHELQTLISKLGDLSESVLVFVGDLVDKGPNSAGVVKYVRQLSLAYRVVLVEGNHEFKHRRYFSHYLREQSHGTPNPIKSEGLAEIQAKLSKEDRQFLGNSVMAYSLEGADACVVHGGVSPRLVDLPAGLRVTDLKGKKKKMASTVYFTRMVSPEGRPVSLGKETDEDVPWASVYDGRFGHVYYGHEHHKEPKEDEHATGLDLGCVYGHKLAAAVLEDGAKGGDHHVVTVQAARAYWDRKLHNLGD